MIEYPPDFGQERVQATKDEIAALQKVLFVKRLTLTVVVLLVAICLVSTAYLAYLIRVSQLDRAPVVDSTAKAAHAARKATRRIENCTTPGRPCYDRGQKQLAETVSGLTVGTQRAVSAAAACAASLPQPDFQAVYLCVLSTLDQHKH